MKKTLPPHINLSSFPGGGKTTLTKLLLGTYSCLLIPKFTTRPPRPVEEIKEYIFMGEEEFLYHKNSDHFIAVEPIHRYGVTYYSAIPRTELWPKIPENTELILSVFGENAPFAKQFLPEMKLCFIDFKNKNILMERLYSRCLLDNSDFEEKRRVIEKYIEIDIKKFYDYIIYNDETKEETMRQILDIVKISRELAPTK